MNNPCENCGATEQNWPKYCSDCKKEFCYKCIDEHICHSTHSLEESGDWKVEFEKDFNCDNYSGLPDGYENWENYCTALRSFILSEKQKSREEGYSQAKKDFKLI